MVVSLPFSPGSNFVDDAPSTNIEDVFDPPLTTLPLIALSFSSTPRDTIISDLALITSPFFLTQSTGLDMGDLLNGDASVLGDASLLLSK